MKGLIFLAAVAVLSAQVRLPEYSRDVLPNGTTIDVVARHGVPLASVHVIVKGGVESDPEGKGGLASLMADLLRRGTAKRTAAQFSDEIDSMGASFETRVNAQATILSLQFLSKDADHALDLAADALFHPAFPETEVKKAIAERIEQAKSLKDEPMAAGNAFYQAFFFGSQHPYGHRSDGDEVSLTRINRADIVASHAKAYAGKNLIVVAAGDFDAASMRNRLVRVFGEAPAGTGYAWQKDPGLPAQNPRLLLVDKPGSAQTYFWIGNRGISRSDPDRVAVWLVNTLVGGRFTSLLNAELRVNAGLTYGAGSRVDENRLSGRFTVVTYTRTEDTTKAIDLALEVLRRLRANGITAEQLASTKAYVKGLYPTERLETSDQLAGLLGEIELFGLTRAEVDELFARIDQVTLEQADAVVKRYFGAGNQVFTILGDAARIRQGVRKYASSFVETPVTQAGFSVTHVNRP